MNNNNLVRVESLAGSNRVIVGERYADLVLETLGKVYIKSGRKIQLLNDVIKQLMDSVNESNNSKKPHILFVEDESHMNTMSYPGDGYFVFNRNTSYLYICVSGNYVAILDASKDIEGDYVKKTGDTMTGPLEIKSNKPNLIISSTKLIENLNAEYLNGLSSDRFAQKDKNETISGQWTFNNTNTAEKPWLFEDNIRVNKDIVLNGNIGSSSFASGYSGYGWRFDASTNTLTIDNLVVRKVMMVYEMVINKIMATNGSLWVSNSSKLNNVFNVHIIETEDSVNYFYYLEEDKIYISYDSEGKITDGLYPDNYYVFKSNLDVYSISGTALYSPNQPSYDSNNVNFVVPLVVYHYTGRDAYLKDGLIEGEESIIIEGAEQIDFLNFLNIDNPNSSTRPFCGFNSFIDNQEVTIYSYFKYFGLREDYVKNNVYVIETDPEEFPMFRQGDIVRCQKYIQGSIKYYDAVIIRQISNIRYLIQVAQNVFDQYTEIKYNEDGTVNSFNTEYNETLYNKTNQRYNKNGDTYEKEFENYEKDQISLTTPSEKDDLIQIGNLCDVNRQNAIYITSTDDQAPYIDVISGLNRPDYSVLYSTIRYIKYKNYYLTTNDSGLDVDIEVWYNIDTKEFKEGDIDSEFGENFVFYYGSKVLDNNRTWLHEYVYSKPTKVRLGNLSGIYDYNFKNKQPHGYGLYADNVYLTGEFILNNGKSVVEFTEDYLKLAIGDQFDEINQNISDLEDDLDGKVNNDDLEGSGLFITENGITLISDKISVITEQGELNGEEPTAMFKDGYLQTKLIKTDELEVNKLTAYSSNQKIIYASRYITNELTFTHRTSGKDITGIFKLKGTYSYNTNLANWTFREGLQSSENIEGFTYYNESKTLIIRKLNNSSTDYYLVLQGPNDNLYLLDLNYQLIDLNETEYDNITLFSYALDNTVNIQYILGNITNRESKYSISFSKRFCEEIIQGDTYSTLTINTLDKGETIMYWPSGYVLNCKIFKLKGSSIAGCVEYFFDDKICTINDVKLGVDQLNNMSYRKKIDYFEDILDYNIFLMKYFGRDLEAVPDFQLTFDEIQNLKSFNNYNEFRNSNYQPLHEYCINYYNYNEAPSFYVISGSNTIKTLSPSNRKIDLSNYVYKSDISEEDLRGTLNDEDLNTDTMFDLLKSFTFTSDYNDDNLLICNYVYTEQTIIYNGISTKIPKTINFEAYLIESHNDFGMINNSKIKGYKSVNITILNNDNIT